MGRDDHRQALPIRAVDRRSGGGGATLPRDAVRSGGRRRVLRRLQATAEHLRAAERTVRGRRHGLTPRYARRVGAAVGPKVTVWGDGEPAVFVHGSFGWAEETWREQRPLAEAYRLVLVDRRGFGASPADGRVDFERDAEDVAELLGQGAHLVGHSYGGVVSLLAAALRPDGVRSLTVIEPPALALARGDPTVERLIRDISAAAAESDDPSEYRARFLRAFGFPAAQVPLEGTALRAAQSSLTERPPWEAEIPLGVLADAGLRVLAVR